MIYVYTYCCPLIYAIFQRGCCRNFIYRCQKCCLVSFRGVCGPRGVTNRQREGRPAGFHGRCRGAGEGMEQRSSGSRACRGACACARPGKVGRHSCSRAQGGAQSRAGSTKLGARRRSSVGVSMEVALFGHHGEEQDLLLACRGRAHGEEDRERRH
jgi:hypothetical protein